MGKYPLNDEQLSKLTTKEKAEKFLLPDELSIKDIGELVLKDKSERYSFYSDLIEVCKVGGIKFTGEIDSFEVDYDEWCAKYDLLEYPDKPYKELNLSEKETRHERYQDAYWELAETDYYEVGKPPNCLIHRDDLKTYLQSIKFWPIEGCLLANWWLDKEKGEINDTNELLVECQKSVAQIKASRTTPGELSIDDLLETSIFDLLDDIRPEDDFSRYFELYVWISQLDKEATRVKNATYRDEGQRESRVENIRKKIKEIDWHLADRPIPDSTLKFAKTPTLEYGEPELLSIDAKGLYPALSLLGKDWTTGEFALYLLNSDIRAFDKKSKEDGLLKPLLNIPEWLKWHGKAEIFSGEQADIDEILLQFVYSKNEIMNFIPDFRYISFNQAIELVSDQTVGKHQAEKFLKSAIKNNELIAWHPLNGALSMEQSLNEELWQYCFFADWQLNKVLGDEFGCSIEKYQLNHSNFIEKDVLGTIHKERELTSWLRETWVKESKPKGTEFFKVLKKYVDKPGSPIVEYITTGKNGARIRWHTGSATNYMSKKSIQNKASQFAKQDSMQIIK